MSNNYFQFKQFKINQEKSAMKVGTDGILLGAWANVSNARNILDIGTGTGLIALMLAQRTSAKIHGIEIEEKAFIEAVNNVKLSPWDNRINIQHVSFQEFVETNILKFDAIVSNPPYFDNSLKPKNNLRGKARHTETLTCSELIAGVDKLLASEGCFNVILPTKRAIDFISQARASALFLKRLKTVKPNEKKETNRYLMEFQKKKTTLQESSLTIYKNEVAEYSDDYKMLTKDFYLNF